MKLWKDVSCVLKSALYNHYNIALCCDCNARTKLLQLGNLFVSKARPLKVWLLRAFVSAASKNRDKQTVDSAKKA